MSDRPPEVCGYTWSDVHDFDAPYHQSCCWRETIASADHCIWHADPDDVSKSIEELQKTRPSPDVRDQNTPVDELLDGVNLSNVDIGETMSFENVSLRFADLSGADLEEADLSGADLIFTDFSDASLNRADLTEADLRETVFSGADLEEGDLSDADLSGADLSGVNLEEADLTGADLEEADLTGANLEGAVLSGASLNSADLSDALLYQADLSNTVQYGVDLSDAFMNRADFTDALLEDADLSGADVEEANFSEADLNSADLSDASLNRAIFFDAYLYGTDLSGADVEEANFSEADLNSADLSGADLDRIHLVLADLSGADLSEAKLWGADLSDANLSEADLSDANLNNSALDRSKFTKAILRGATLPSGTQLSNADLTECDLEGQDLRNAKLVGANLQKANLTDVDLSRADLSEANLERALLNRTDLFDTCFAGAYLEGAVFGDAQINEGTFERLAPDGARADDDTGVFDRLARLVVGPTGDGALRCVYDPKSQYSLTDREKRGMESVATLDEEEHVPEDGVAKEDEDEDEDEDSDLWNVERPKRHDDPDYVPPADEEGEYEKDELEVRAGGVYRQFERLARDNALPYWQQQFFLLRQDMQTRQKTGIDYRFSQLQRALFGHGEHFGRVIGWSSVIIFAFSLIYLLGGWIRPVTPSGRLGQPIVWSRLTEDPTVLWESLYYSTLTFTALGFGDFRPISTVGQLLTILETASGAILLALLVFVLGRRAAR